MKIRLFTGMSILIFYLILSFSCQNYANQVKSTVGKIVLTDSLNNKLVLIIPKLGCSYCLSSTLQFAEQNKENKKLIIIAVGFKSQKELKLEFGSSLVNRKNFFWDKKKLAFKENLVEYNSAYFVFNESKLIKTEKQSFEQSSNFILNMQLELKREQNE